MSCMSANLRRLRDGRMVSKVRGLPVLDTVLRGVPGTEAGTGGNWPMPSIPFAELALTHAERRLLRTWENEGGKHTRSSLTDPSASPIIVPCECSENPHCRMEKYHEVCRQWTKENPAFLRGCPVIGPNSHRVFTRQ